MKLNEIGEFGFIERFTPWFGSLKAEQIVGIGDDCAIIPFNENEDMVITTDLLIEEIHFIKDHISPFQLGFKSLAVNLSDIAAMGAVPTGSFLSIAIPNDTDLEYMDLYMKGYLELSKKYNVPLLGGDTTRSAKHIAINVCVIGKCAKGNAKRRNMAKEDDIICVTGNLGDSAGGLQVILNKLTNSAEHEYLISKHYLPEPRLNEGKFLSEFTGVNAMMDISDGIGSDLKHILKASGKSAKINVEQLPVSDELKNVAGAQNWKPELLAISGGEDYELLLTIDIDNFKTISDTYYKKFGKYLTSIGSIEKGEPEIHWFNNNVEIEMSKTGFNHFQ